MVLDLPTSRSVDVLAIPTLDVIGNNSQMLGVRLMTEQLLKQPANDRNHARGQNNDRDVVFLGPVVEFGKVWVQFHVLLQDLNALGETGLDAVQHITEGIPKRGL